MDKYTFSIGNCSDCNQSVTPAHFIGPNTLKCPNCGAEHLVHLDMISENEMNALEAEYEAKCNHEMSIADYEEMQADVHINLAKDSNNYGDPDYLPF